LEFQKDFEFTIEMLPIPKTVTTGVPVEMRFELSSIGGSYDSTQYFVRYFQYDGKGQLADESGTVFFPNDSYLVPNKKFRLYFTPTSGDSHTLELVFYDSFKRQQVFELTFAMEQQNNE
jgi:hypothetical protein